MTMTVMKPSAANMQIPPRFCSAICGASRLRLVNEARGVPKLEKENKDGVTIYVNATCLFGGVDIK